MNNRRTRVNEEIQRELSNVMRELKDPRIGAMTTVLRVETTTDLSNSKVFVSIYGNDEEKKKVMEGLKSAAGFMRRELAIRINLRNTPQLKFIFDDSIEYGAKISELIQSVIKKE